MQRPWKRKVCRSGEKQIDDQTSDESVICLSGFGRSDLRGERLLFTTCFHPSVIQERRPNWRREFNILEQTQNPTKKNVLKNQVLRFKLLAEKKGERI